MKYFFVLVVFLFNFDFYSFAHSVKNSATERPQHLDCKEGGTTFVGDSITHGLPTHHNKMAIKGATSGTLLSSIPNCKSDKFLLMIGMNDASVGYSPVETVSNIKQIAERLIGEVVIIAVTPTDNDYLNKKIGNLNIALSRLAESEGYEFSNPTGALIDTDKINPSFTTDGVHLSKLGYDKLLEFLKVYTG